ncbi:M48 family metalloprotease [Corticibacterium sp. UT-5YL-CI-8]|nr:M48 family metalloprotease [Tianweitania sp. UT-5YL-CI-8]
MIKLFVKAATRFGRLAVLFFVVPALLIGAVWLSLLDRYPMAVLASSVVIIPMLLLAVTLLLGTLFLGFRNKTDPGVTEEQAPGIWRLWREVAGEKQANKTVIVINDDYNAAISETRGLVGRRPVLFIGLPLLALLDERAVKAVLAHELAHFRHKDTNGSLKLMELEMSFDAIFDYAPPGRTVSGSVLYWALGPIAKAFHEEEMRLSRVAEIKADRLSAELGDAYETARTLMLVVAGTQLLKERVYHPLNREVRGAMSVPKPPMERILKEAHCMQDADMVQTMLLAPDPDGDDDSESTHPHWRKRLAALGYEELPLIDPPVAFALDRTLDKTFIAEKIAEFDGKWTSMVGDYLDR